MATSGDLIDCLARTLDLPPNAVLYPLRRLRDAGHISKGKRGRGGAQITAKDAATLMLAITGRMETKDVVQAYVDYADLTPSGGHLSIKTGQHSFEQNGNPPPTWSLTDMSVPLIHDLGPNHTYWDALAALFESARCGDLRKGLEQAAKISREQSGQGIAPEFYKITVQTRVPFIEGRININAGRINEWKNYNRIGFYNEQDSRELERQIIAEAKTGDLTQVREFTDKTVFAVGDVLNN